jgi:hypothetical protein
MIRRFSNDSDAVLCRRWGLFAISLLALLGVFLLPLCVDAKSIFDDDWTPPAREKPVVPHDQTPEVKPAPDQVNPNTPDTPKTDTPATVPAPALPNVAPDARKPQPSVADRAKSRAIFDELYAKEMADYTPTARRALANKLIDQAATMKDSPSDQYMLLIGATAAGKEASDLSICFRAADAMAETFDVDALRFKSQTAANVKLRGQTPTVTAENCQAALTLLDQLLAAGDLADAQSIIKALRAAAPDATTTSQIAARAKALDTLRAAEEHVAPYLQKLKTARDDATANLEVGKYLCFIRGDWKQGLLLLAKGGKTGVSAVAALDLAGTSDPQKQADLGDAWWNLGEKETGPAQSAMRRRAVSWYGPALETQTISGLKRVLLEKRVASAAPGPAISSPVGKPPSRAIILLAVGGMEAPFQAINNGELKDSSREDIAAFLANPDVYKGINVVVWGVNRWRTTPPERFTEGAQQAMQQFVRNGGDLVIFEQFSMTHMDIFEHIFGIKTGRAEGGAHIIPQPRQDAAATTGMTQDDLDHVKFYNSYGNLPKGSIVFVRDNGGRDVIVMAPFGKGRLIMFGTNFDKEERKLNEEILDVIYHWKAAKP